MADDELRAPFPWFGGKRRVAPLVWSRLGNVDTYNEPFAGSLAVLLGRPHGPKIETVNDLDCMIANFWRALQWAPDDVAAAADWPVNEADLHARHRWLVEHGKPIVERLRTEPEFFDAKIAGWWVWGQCLWIGSGWCQSSLHQQLPFLNRPGAGIHAKQVAQFDRNPQGAAHQNCRPHLTSDQGVHIVQKRPKLRERGHDGVGGRRWQGGGQGGGSGVHAPRLSQQLPALNGDAGATGHGILASGFEAKTGGLYVYMRQLAERLRRVRVCCGDWKRVLTPSVTTYIGTTGVFLDPPYAHELRERCYAEDHDISSDVRAWAIEHGDDPNMRIALCGYEGEHVMPASWECVPWKAHGGYSRSERGRANRERERIWFSRFCLKPSESLLSLL